jgi:AraC family transcriptional regulator of adaptative response/methylated-DNA-[protein]-cysteine methyltransferase
MTMTLESPAGFARDYDRVQQAIEYLDRVHPRQPSLKELATHAGLSEFHFQRIFSRWAGVSPKRFMQFQTLAHAKALLKQSANLLNTSWEVGLSGGSRLHDLFVSAEAVTPGSYKASGDGLEIRYGFHATPFGEALIAVTQLGICGLSFVVGQRSTALEELQARWARARLVRDQKATAAYIESIFGASGQEAPIRLALKGTNFQLKVWEALLRVPSGAVTTYQDIAVAIGDARASRAVGTAVGQNPIAYLIPCHRVIKKTGAFGEYHWGAARKHAMLGWEAARRFGEAS